jgi:glycosyltransferase involved in cell wall biosynthesis
MKISVCMIVRNESGSLASALQSVPPHYERIVVDTGSDDDTIRIAERCGANVYHFPWIDDFAAARNESIQHATGDYVFVLDADEQFTDRTGSEIEEHIRRYPDEAAIVTLHNEIDGEVHRTRMIRLLPNRSDFRYQGIVHEQLYEGNIPAEAKASGINLIHKGYEKAIYEAQRKDERYLRLYSKQSELHPHDGYLHYQIGKLHYSRHRYPEACASFECCVALKEEERLYFPPMLVMYGYTLKNLNRSVEAETLLTPYLSHYPSFPDLPFLLGLLAMDTMKVQDIERHFLCALEIGETAKYSTVEGVGSYKAAYNVGVYYELTGQLEKARTAYGIAADSSYAPAIHRLRQLTR